MKIKKIKKRDLDLFASVMPAFGALHAPVRRGESYVFGRPALWSDVVLSYPRTVLPPRKYVLPPREEMFRFCQQHGYRESWEVESQRIVLFGVHAYDIYGLNILDRVFLQGPYPDPFYRRRRASTMVIGIDYEPDDRHFARSMSADFVDSGFDLYLSDLGEDYLCLIGTSRGDDLVVMSGCMLADPTAADFAQYKKRSAARQERQGRGVELADLPEILEMEYDSEVWEELGRRCLSCGACSMVCPTCYCFDVNDEVELGVQAGRRVRSWDSCLFKTHALVAGGENFRKSRASRIKFRYYHKQRGFVAEYGRPSCVGCGRCAVSCPAEIDIVSVIEKIRGQTDEHRVRAAASDA